MTLSLAAVFIPVLFMGGVLGRCSRNRHHHLRRHPDLRCRLRHPYAHAVQPLPALGARGEAKPVLPLTEKFFQGMLHVYDVSLRWVLHYRPVTMAVSAVVLAPLCICSDHSQGLHSGPGHRPDAGLHRSRQGTSYYQMVDYEQKIADLVSKDPNVDSLMASVGAPRPPTWAAQLWGTGGAPEAA